MAGHRPVRRPAEFLTTSLPLSTGSTTGIAADEHTASPGRRVLGIDPGLGTTGYGVIEAADAICGTTRADGIRSTGGFGVGTGRRMRLVEAGIIRAARPGNTEAGSLPSRLHEIFRSVIELIEQYRPDAISLEELYSHYERPMTAVIMGHARGVICLAGAVHGIPVISYPATRIKKLLTGSGRATKQQIQQAVRFELNLAAVPDPPDIADAIALAICHHYIDGKI